MEEIADLLAIWDGTNCGATQERLSALLAAKRAEIGEQIRELGRFADQLAEVETRLTATPALQDCAPDLACCAPEMSAAPVPVSLQLGRPAEAEPPAPEDGPAIACTLTPTEWPARLAELEALSAHLSSWTRSDTNLRLRFPARPDVEAQVRELMAREQGCCAFLSFTLQSVEDEWWGTSKHPTSRWPRPSTSSSPSLSSRANRGFDDPAHSHPPAEVGAPVTRRLRDSRGVPPRLHRPGSRGLDDVRRTGVAGRRDRWCRRHRRGSRSAERWRRWLLTLSVPVVIATLLVAATVFFLWGALAERSGESRESAETAALETGNEFESPSSKASEEGEHSETATERVAEAGRNEGESAEEHSEEEEFRPLGVNLESTPLLWPRTSANASSSSPSSGPPQRATASYRRVSAVDGRVPVVNAFRTDGVIPARSARARWQLAGGEEELRSLRAAEALVAPA